MRGKRFGAGTTATLLLALLLGCGGYHAAQTSARSKGRAFDPATGTVRWTASLSGSIFGFPAVADDGTVYTGTTNGTVVPIR